VLRQLHWLPVRQRVVFKIATVLVRRQRARLPGQRLSRVTTHVVDARNCVLPTLDTRCQSDAQQFWRRDLCRRRITSLEQSGAWSQTMWAVIRKTLLFGHWTVRPRR